jgi:putative MFS transporter
VLLSAWLVEVVGRKWVIGVSAPISAAALIAFAASLHVQTAALVWLGVFGFLIQVAVPVLYAYVSELYPTRIRASGFGWASSVSRAVTGFIPYIFGSLLKPALGLTWTFTLLTGVTVAVVLWMAVGAPETKGLDLDESETEGAGVGEPGADEPLSVGAA